MKPLPLKPVCMFLRSAAVLLSLLTVSVIFAASAWADAGQRLRDAAEQGDLGMLDDAIRAGADVESADSHGVRALMLSSGAGNYNAAQRLLELGADAEATDDRGRTALMCAAENGHVVVGRLLLAAGASVTKTDKQGRSALDVADANGQFVMYKALGGTYGEAGIGDIQALTGKMNLLYEQGRYTEAIVPAEQILELTEEGLGPGHPATASAANNLGVIYEAAGDDRNALANYQRALSIRKKALGAGSPAAAESLNNLGAFHYNTGDIEKSVELFGGAAAALEKSLGPTHPATLRTMDNLATALDEAGEDGKAAVVRSRTRSVRTGNERRKEDGPSISPVGLNMNALGGEGLSAFRAVPPTGKRVLGGRLGPVNLDASKMLKFALAVLCIAVAAFVTYKTRIIQRAIRYKPFEDKKARLEFVKKQFYNNAVAAEKSGQYDDAVVEYERLLGLDPNHHLARLNLARVYQFGVGNVVKSRNHYEMLMRRLPVGHPFYREASEALHRFEHGY